MAEKLEPFVTPDGKGIQWITKTKDIEADLETLKNHEVQFIYYEVVEFTGNQTGSITIPAGATLDEEEYALEGNSLEAVVDGQDKPTEEVPRSVLGTVITGSLDAAGNVTLSENYTGKLAIIFSLRMTQFALAEAKGNAAIDSNRILSLVDRGEKETFYTFIIDTTKTSGSPLSLSSGVSTRLDINSSVVVEDELPDGVQIDDIFQNGVFNPLNLKDNYILTLFLIANSSVNNRNFTIQFRVLGAPAVPVIWEDTVRLARGAGNDTKIVRDINVFAGTDFFNDGGEIYVECDGACDVFDVRLKISRIGRAKNV